MQAVAAVNSGLDKDAVIHLCVWGLQGFTKSSMRSWFEELLGELSRTLVAVQRVEQKRDNRCRWDLTLEDHAASGAKALNAERKLKALVKIKAGAFARRDRNRQPEERTPKEWSTVALRTGAMVSLNVGTTFKRQRELAALATSELAAVLALQETRRTATRRADGLLVLNGGYKFVERLSDPSVPGAHGLALGAPDQFVLQQLDYVSPFVLVARVLPPAGRRNWIVASVYVPVAGRRTGKSRQAALEAVKRFFAAVLARFPRLPVLFMGDFNMRTEALSERVADWGMDASVLQMSGPAGTYKTAGGDLTDIDHFVANAEARRLLQDPTVCTSYHFSTHFPIVVRPTHIAARQGVAVEIHQQRTTLDRAGLLRAAAQLATANQFAVLADDDAAPEAAPAPSVPLSLRSFTAALNAAAVAAKATKTQRRTLGPKAYFFGARTKKLLAERDMASTEAERRALTRKLRKAQRADERAHLIKTLKAAVAAREGGDCRSFWRFVRGAMRGVKTTTAQTSVATAVRDSTGRLCTQPRDVLRVWRDYFLDLSAAKTQRAKWTQAQWESAVPLPAREELPGTSHSISWAEVVQAVKTMPAGKAAGADGILPEALRALLADAAGKIPGDDEVPSEPTTPGGRALLRLVNKLFASEQLPEEARSAVVVPIPKPGGDERVPNDHRGISLMSVPLKVVCRVVAARLDAAFKSAKLIRPEQAGFLSREECMGHVCALVEAVQRRQKAGKVTYAAFIDFRKAFDTVPHGALLHVAEKAGVRGRCLSFIRALYSNPTLQVRVGDKATESIPLEQGVRQGDPLSPTLFSLFINSVLDGVKGVKVHDLGGGLLGLLFADDVAAFGFDRASMLATLQRIGDWATRWGMTINQDKCGLVVFSYPGADGAPAAAARAVQEEARTQSWPLQGGNIPVVDQYKYLGVMINKDLDFTVHVAYRAEQGRKALFAARDLLANPAVPLGIKRSVYLTGVRPALVYGAELLGGMNRDLFKPLQEVQTTAVRWMVGLGAKPATHGALLQAEMGIPPIFAAAAAAKVRALIKYPTLGTVISKLLGGKRGKGQAKVAGVGAVQLWSAVGRARFTTLTKNSDVGSWEAVEAGDAADVARVVSAVRDLLADEAVAAATKKTVAGKKYAELDLYETTDYVRRSAAFVRAAPCMAWLMRARCQLFQLGYQKAAAGKADVYYSTHCCACGEANNKGDDWVHLVGACRAYSAARERYLLPLWEAYGAAADQAGEEGLAVSPSPEELYALAAGSGADGAAASFWLRGCVTDDASSVSGEEGEGSDDDAGSSVGSSVSHPSSLGVRGLGESGLGSEGKSATAMRAGYILAAKFFGSVLPAHRRRVQALPMGGVGHEGSALADGGMAAAAAAVAPPVPGGANAANAVGPLDALAGQ